MVRSKVLDLDESKTTNRALWDVEELKLQPVALAVNEKRHDTVGFFFQIFLILWKADLKQGGVGESSTETG